MDGLRRSAASSERPRGTELWAVGDSRRDRAASATEICLDWHVVNSESNLNSYLQPSGGPGPAPPGVSRTPAESGGLARAASGAAKRRRERPLTRIRAGIVTKPPGRERRREASRRRLLRPGAPSQPDSESESEAQWPLSKLGPGSKSGQDSRPRPGPEAASPCHLTTDRQAAGLSPRVQAGPPTRTLPGP